MGLFQHFLGTGLFVAVGKRLSYLSHGRADTMQYTAKFSVSHTAIL